MKKTCLTLFVVLGILHVTAILLSSPLLTDLTKPLLMTSLAGWFFMNTKGSFNYFAKYILLALVFSFFGDVFLIFSGKNPSYFLLGLGSFLIAHLFYLTAFVKYPGFSKGAIVQRKWLMLPVIGYLLVFGWCLWPDLPSGFAIPVIVYAVVISTMLMAAVNMNGRVNKSISLGLVFGAMSFVLSDTLIALNKFKGVSVQPQFMSTAIMVTYLLGQYLIVWNSLRAYIEKFINQTVPRL